MQGDMLRGAPHRPCAGSAEGPARIISKGETMPPKIGRFEIEQVAGNGLLDRRALLGRGVMLAGAMGAGAVGSVTGAAAEPLKDGPWSLEVGDAIPPYQTPSPFEKVVVRTVDNPKNEPRNSRARTPHHLLKGI